MNIRIIVSKSRFVFICILILIIKSQLLFSQTTEKQIDEQINAGNFEQAIKSCEELLLSQPENPNLNFKLGYCLLNTPLKKNQSIPYLQKANQLYTKSGSQAPEAIETKFYLGQAYHKNYDFDKALEEFEKMKTELKNKEMLAVIDQEIDQCNTGKMLINQPINMHVTNLGNQINSIYADHSPVISADETLLIFTSRRKINNNEIAEPDGQYNENIYLSSYNGKNWSEPSSISNLINTDFHEASIGLSADGQQLLVYKEADGGTILISTLIGDEWSAPVDAGSNINTRFRETSASISADGKMIFFTSDRPGGYGGMDIYNSAKQADGSWGPAVNLGPAINTDKDEDGPFIHPDGNTLYFSSKGHETMGGYDIFVSKKNEFNTWTLPENYGYPVNTTEDDIFFVMTADGKRAYFASYREGGIGSMDIYMMGLPEAEEVPLTIVKGTVAACKSDIGNVQIKVYESGKDEVLGVYKPNSKTGKYLFILSRGKKYNAVYEINNSEAHREVFQIGTDADFQILYRQVELKTGRPCEEYVGLPFIHNDIASSDSLEDLDESSQYTIIENIMFRINSSEADSYNENINKLALYLKKNKNVKIEIIGYTDTQGPESYNLKLSGWRAETIYKQLLKQGVKKEQLSYRGDGLKNQITINNYPDGSYIWQSLPYNRRVEFLIINNPAKNLKIKHYKLPEIYDLQKHNTFDPNQFKQYENKYTVQVGAFSKPIGNNHFKNLKNIQVYYMGKLYHYTVGEFDSEESAKQELKKAINNGYKDAFIRQLSFYFPSKK